jgi:hypothetical protein
MFVGYQILVNDSPSIRKDKPWVVNVFYRENKVRKWESDFN